MSRYVKSLVYLVASGVIGLACFAVFQPSAEEVEKIRNFSARNPGFSAAIETAAKSEAPIYRMKSGQIQAKVQETLEKRE